MSIALRIVIRWLPKTVQFSQRHCCVLLKLRPVSVPRRWQGLQRFVHVHNTNNSAKAEYTMTHGLSPSASSDSVMFYREVAFIYRMWSD